jgi:hypothetical protein
MPTLLARNAAVLVTMDDGRRELHNAGLFARDGIIEQVGPTEQLPSSADRVLDLTGQIVLPGFVNTHHHLDQTLTRNLPAAQDNNLFRWLKVHYRVWASRTPEASRGSTLIGLAELAASGCTTVFDHAYVFKNGCRVDDQIAAAKEIGMRFHACRGSMSLGESKGRQRQQGRSTPRGDQAAGRTGAGGGSAASPSAARSRRTAWGSVTAPRIRRRPPQRSHTSRTATGPIPSGGLSPAIRCKLAPTGRRRRPRERKPPWRRTSERRDSGRPRTTPTSCVGRSTPSATMGTCRSGRLGGI